MATVRIPIAMGSLVPFTTAIPTLFNVAGTNFPNFGWQFTPASNHQLVTERLYAVNYGASNPQPTLAFDFYSPTGVTTGNVQWSAALSVLTPGDAQSVLTDAFATASTQTTTINGTASGLTRSTVTIANLDSLTADDSFVLKIICTSSSTISGNVALVGLTLAYSDT